MATVTMLAASLEKHLDNHASFRAVSTRVLLRTGVNLTAPKPGQDGDQAAVNKVRTALSDMGYRL